MHPLSNFPIGTPRLFRDKYPTLWDSDSFQKGTPVVFAQPKAYRRTMNTVHEEKPIHVHIRRNADGVVRLYEDIGFFDKFGFEDYIWSEGNYACDCNRHLFFVRAGGDEDDEDEGDDDACSSGLYAVKITNPAGSETLYQDDDWDSG